MGVRVSFLLPTILNDLIMDNFLVKEYIGEFFAKMYAANKGKDMEVTLKMDEDKIQIYHKGENYKFKDIVLIDERPSIDGLVKSVSE